jgi:hypothetical protein
LDSIFFLLVFSAYSAFVLFATKWAMRRASIPCKKTALKIALPVVLYLAPVADGIYGYFTLQYLCATEAKTELLRPIRIPAEYFNADGSPRYAINRGKAKDVDWRMLKNVIEIKNIILKNYRARNLELFVEELIDVQQREPLARQSFFYFSGGWLQIGGWKTWSDSCIPDTGVTEIVLRDATRKP